MPTLTIQYTIYKQIEVDVLNIEDIDEDKLPQVTPEDIKDIHPEFAFITTGNNVVPCSQKFFNHD